MTLTKGVFLFGLNVFCSESTTYQHKDVISFQEGSLGP